MNTRCIIAGLGCSLAGLTGFVMLAGCTADGNSRPELGDLRVGDSDRAVLVTDLSVSHARPETTATVDLPSLDGLSRASWSRTTIVVPVDGVEAMPRYRRDFPRTQATARQRAEYPTELTALELSGATDEAQWTEALASPLYALAGAGALVPRMIFVQPWQATRHLPEQHWRAPVNTPRLTRDEVERLEASRER